LGSEQLEIDAVAQAVQHQQVHLLDAHGAVVRHADVHVAGSEHAGGLAAATPGERTVTTPSSRAARTAATTLPELPEVEIASSTSPLRPRARSCFSNTWS
jgi:hypothetical protein